eukprot:2548174-Rhodomonas_salina.1
MQNVMCGLDHRQHTDTEAVAPERAFLFALDRASLRRAGVTLWSMEQAKFKFKFTQWQTSRALSDAEAAGLGQAGHATAIMINSNGIQRR